MPPTQKQFESDGGIIPKKLSVFLEGETNDTMFYCIYCRCPVMRHCQRVVMVLPEGNINSMPIEIKCKNKKCGTVYSFYSLV